ncbi:MAG: hypothetical protein KDA61_00050, partial [Planctomycetales bacterium]|nr:hypothetical protein [Planctomycetales bacterium]
VTLAGRAIAVPLVSVDVQQRPDLDFAVVAVDRVGRRGVIGATYNPVADLAAARLPWRLSQATLNGVDADAFSHIEVKLRTRCWAEFSGFATTPVAGHEADDAVQQELVRPHGRPLDAAPSPALHAAAAVAAAASSDEPWGTPIDGLQCRLVAVAPQTSDEVPDASQSVEQFADADQVTFAVELRNVSDEALNLLDVRYGDGYGDARGRLSTSLFGPHLFEFEFFDEQGRPIARAQREYQDPLIVLSGAGAPELAPGATRAFLLRPAQFRPPMDFRLGAGRYRARVHYRGLRPQVRSEMIKRWPDRAQSGAWGGDVASNDVEFAVVQDDAPTKPDPLVWGPEQDGLRGAIAYELTATPDNPATPPGVPRGTKIGVVCHVQNVSSRTITFVSESARQGDELRVTDSNGRVVEVA